MIDDGRMFGWQRSLLGLTPVVIWDKLHGSTKNVELVGGLRTLDETEYGMTLAELAARYPAPQPTEE